VKEWKLGLAGWTRSSSRYEMITPSHTLMELGATSGRSVFSILRILSLFFRLFRFNYVEISLVDLSEFRSQSLKNTFHVLIYSTLKGLENILVDQRVIPGRDPRLLRLNGPSCPRPLITQIYLKRDLLSPISCFRKHILSSL